MTNNLFVKFKDKRIYQLNKYNCTNKFSFEISLEKRLLRINEDITRYLHIT